MPRLFSFAIIAVFIFPCTLFADEVRLETGAVLTGRIVEEGDDISDDITIDLPGGRLTIPADQVEVIVPGRTPLHDYRDKRAAIDGSTEAADYFSLAFWAKTNGLSQYVRPLLKHTIALNPDHERARALLGFIRHEGEWLTKSQFNRAQGLVRYRGKWMKPDERDAIVRAIKDRREERRRERRERLLAARDRAAQRAWNRRGASRPRYDGYGSDYGSVFHRRSALHYLGWKSPYYYKYPYKSPYYRCPPIRRYPPFYKKLIIKIP